MPLTVVRLPLAEAADAIRAAWDRGEAVAPLDPRATPTEYEQLLAAVQPTEPVHPDVAAVVTTSGTTGAPRAVELTWDGLRAMAAWDEPGSRWLLTLPVHHVAGLAVLARSWVSGLPSAFDDTSGATRVSLVPTQVRRLLADGVDLSRFDRILVGGGPVPDDVRALPNVVATYGLTETWGGVLHDGRALPGVEVTLASNGEILLRTPTIMRGYRLDDAATAAAFTAEGRLRTGDVGTWTEEGRLQVVDRLRDIIITGGVNVSPSEVERVLAAHPTISDVAVAGVPDDEWGERVVAHVVPADPSAPPSLADLRAFAWDRLSAPKLPRQLVITDALPRTTGGKLLRRLLKDAGASTGYRQPS